MVFRSHRAGKVYRAAGNVGMNVDATGKNHHSGRVDGATAASRRDKLVGIGVQVADLAVDPVGGIVNRATGNRKHADESGREIGAERTSVRYTRGVAQKTTDKVCATMPTLYLRLEHLGSRAHPIGLIGDCLIDSADDFFVGRIGALQRRSQRYRDFIHTVSRTGRH